MNIIDALNNIAIEIRAQYGPGYSSPWSDVHTEIFSKGPIRNPDADNPRGEPRGWQYSTVENDMIEEWGEDKGIKPNGVEEIIVDKRCPRCHGNGCVKCKFKGIIKDKVKMVKTNPRFDGRMKNQLRYDPYGKYWPWNRDYNNIREEVQTWDQLMADKEFLGRPSMF